MQTLEEKRAYDAEYRQRDYVKVKRRAQARAWRAANPERLAEYTRRQSEYRREWAKKNKDRVNAASRKKARERRAIVTEAKNRPCVDCGVQYPAYVMDLDHVRGDKTGNISLLCTKASVKRLKEEIEKCDVRCANCHRLRHGTNTRGVAA